MMIMNMIGINVKMIDGIKPTSMLNIFQAHTLIGMGLINVTHQVKIKLTFSITCLTMNNNNEQSSHFGTNSYTRL